MQNEIKEKSSNWGGARKGAGRPRTEKGKYYGFYSTPNTEAIIESVNGSKSAFINDAIRFYSTHLNGEH